MTFEEQQRILYRKAHGLCVQCGKRPAYQNRTRCEDCLAKSRAYYRDKKQQKEENK